MDSAEATYAARSDHDGGRVRRPQARSTAPTSSELVRPSDAARFVTWGRTATADRTLVDHHVVRGLQRQVGNRAVADLLRGNRTSTTGPGSDVRHRPPRYGTLRTRDRAAPAVVQRIRSVADFQARTPGSLLKSRRTISSIDTALGAYVSAPGPQKSARAVALLAAVDAYLAGADHDPARVLVVNALRVEIVAEQALLNHLGAVNGGLLDDLVARATAKGGIAELSRVAAALGAPFATLLPALVDAAPNHPNGLDVVRRAVLTIQPANSYLLPGLVRLAGGPAGFAQLETMIGRITVANAWMLVRLLTLVPNVATLDGLIQAAGAAHAGLLEKMIDDVGGAAQVPALTAAINRHPGAGDRGAALAARAARNGVRFAELAGTLQHFNRSAPVAAPAAVQNAVNAYNTAPGIPFNRRIEPVAFDHFLTRHTMEYFDFANISPRNDLWAVPGPAVVGHVAGLVGQAIMDFTALAAAGAVWYLQPNVAQPVVVNGFQAQIGVTGNGAGTLPHPGTGAMIPGVKLGQFYPAGGPGVIPMDRDDMNAIHGLV